MSSPFDRPSVSRRLAAILSIVLVAAVAVATIVLVFDRIGSLLAVLALDCGDRASPGGTRSRASAPHRTVAVSFAIAALVAVVVIVIVESAGWSLVWRFGALVLAVLLARYALARDVKTLKAERDDRADQCLQPSTAP